MVRLCLTCRNEVPDHAKFCRTCGSKLTEVKQKNEVTVCPDCGKAVPDGAKFCRHCGTSISKHPQKPVLPQDRISCAAPETPGELVFPAAIIASAASEFSANPSFKAVVVSAGPIKLLMTGGWHLFKGFFASLKSPKKLMPGVLLGLMWFIVSILPALGITLPGQDIASWLTFAHGGLQGGVPGAVGGILGKGIFAAVLVRLFTRNSRRPHVLDTKDREHQQRGSFGLLLIGIGLALVLFNFFTWDNSLQNSMIGVIAALGTLRAMGREQGFLRRLVTALAQWCSPNRIAGTRDVGILGSGLAAGFALAVPMSLIAGSWTGYALGVVIISPGVLIVLKQKSGEAVKAA